jgi:hypothetical protein
MRPPIMLRGSTTTLFTLITPPLTSATDYYYPWTRLGYTYDWAPDAKEVGMSEYVLQTGSGIWVEQTTTAAAFFKN